MCITELFFRPKNDEAICYPNNRFGVGSMTFFTLELLFNDQTDLEVFDLRFPSHEILLWNIVVYYIQSETGFFDGKRVSGYTLPSSDKLHKSMAPARDLSSEVLYNGKMMFWNEMFVAISRR